MSRIRLVEIEDMNPRQRAQYDRYAQPASRVVMHAITASCLSRIAARNLESIGLLLVVRQAARYVLAETKAT